MVLQSTITIGFLLPTLAVLLLQCFGARLCGMEVIDLAEVMRKVKLASMPTDVLDGPLIKFGYTLGKLRNFADKEQRSILELAQDVDLASTWVRLCEGTSQRSRDFQDMVEYILARQDYKTYRWVRQWWHVKKALRRAERDTDDIAELFARVVEHRESVGRAIYKKYGPMRDLLDQYDALSEKIVAARTTIARKVDELNEEIEEFADMVPSMEAAFALNDRNDAIMEALVEDMRILVVERHAVAQRMYDYEVERQRFLHLPPLEEGQLKSLTTPQV